MKVDETLVLTLEKLARLQLNPEARSRFCGDLEKMLKMVDTLKHLDTMGVEPLVYMSDEIRAPASDVTQAAISREMALKNAPHHNNAYFSVPKVIDK
jgi:aspartyl-tRNA(Asn)/glutamyl-tRNA(Gln) amidotransferase subunit C